MTGYMNLLGFFKESTQANEKVGQFCYCQVFFDITIGNQPAGRVVFGLYGAWAWGPPIGTCQNHGGVPRSRQEALFQKPWRTSASFARIRLAKDSKASRSVRERSCLEVACLCKIVYTSLPCLKERTTGFCTNRTLQMQHTLSAMESLVSGCPFHRIIPGFMCQAPP